MDGNEDGGQGPRRGKKRAGRIEKVCAHLRLPPLPLPEPLLLKLGLLLLLQALLVRLIPFVFARVR